MRERRCEREKGGERESERERERGGGGGGGERKGVKREKGGGERESMHVCKVRRCEHKDRGHMCSCFKQDAALQPTLTLCR